ncbi:MAG: hypothetical protein AAF383_04610 [Cyanobacteria bacterium P01_A01_bin.83]
MRSTLDKGTGSKRSNSARLKSSARDLSFKSYSDDEFTEDDLRHRIRSLETNLFAEYCSELPDAQIEQLCNRR